MARKRSKRYREARTRRRHMKWERWALRTGILQKETMWYKGAEEFGEFSGFALFQDFPADVAQR